MDTKHINSSKINDMELEIINLKIKLKDKNEEINHLKNKLEEERKEHREIYSKIKIEKDELINLLSKSTNSNLLTYYNNYDGNISLLNI